MIDKSFGFDTAVEEAQRAINAAHVEVESVENGVGIVKLMGRYSGKRALAFFLLTCDYSFCVPFVKALSIFAGFIAMHATLASRDVVIDISYLGLLLLCLQFIICLLLLLCVCFLFVSLLVIFSN